MDDGRAVDGAVGVRVPQPRVENVSTAQIDSCLRVMCVVDGKRVLQHGRNNRADLPIERFSWGIAEAGRSGCCEIDWRSDFTLVGHENSPGLESPGPQPPAQPRRHQ